MPIITPDEFAEQWNLSALVNGWRPCRKMTAARANSLRQRLMDAWWRDNWREALQKAGPIPGLRGQNDRKWIADIDWFLRPGTVVKILEGFYDAWGPKQTVLAGVPSKEQSARKIAESREYSRKAFEEWQARGDVPKLARE